MTGDVVEPLVGVEPSPHRRPLIGYLLYLSAAALFAVMVASSNR